MDGEQFRSSGTPPKIVYVCHPFASDPVRHAARVRSIGRRLAVSGDLPLVPHLLLGPILREDRERDLAMRLCLQLVSLADEVRVYGDPSEGMRLEIAEAERLGIPVVREELP